MPRALTRHVAGILDQSAGALRSRRCRPHLAGEKWSRKSLPETQPSHAHRLRHAQPHGLSLKVSDEFTVPFARFTTTKSTPHSRNKSGGRSGTSILSKLPLSCGKRAVSAFLAVRNIRAEAGAQSEVTIRPPKKGCWRRQPVSRHAIDQRRSACLATTAAIHRRQLLTAPLCRESLAASH